MCVCAHIFPYKNSRRMPLVNSIFFILSSLIVDNLNRKRINEPYWVTCMY